jgi:hypothetical protein
MFAAPCRDLSRRHDVLGERGDAEYVDARPLLAGVPDLVAARISSSGRIGTAPTRCSLPSFAR